MKPVVFFDLEVNPEKKKILDIGAVHTNGATLHKNDHRQLLQFFSGAEYIAGHNIFAHDLKYLQALTGEPVFPVEKTIDTLLMAPMLYPGKQHHNLLKDDKLQADELNNPVNDSKKARDLFIAECDEFNQLPQPLKNIYIGLLAPVQFFSAFFNYAGCVEIPGARQTEKNIREYFHEKICAHCDLGGFISRHPVELAYALALLNGNTLNIVTPPWVLYNHPETERILFLLSNTPCIPGCGYCNKALNPFPALEHYFGFTGFRQYGNEPLQENAVKAAIKNESLLAVFPTGGGKSITFQVPALMSGRNARALTVVISPLQSLMKDQVDNLEKKGITEAVTINGLLDPIERAKAIERVENGTACMLYIAPESLRSVTITKLLQKRKIARFVIDEAHCFSAWGQDFRVDYLYIGDFIKSLQQLKNMETPIPVSCFTATAKQKVIEDIIAYFREKLNLSLQLFKAGTGRTNLHYRVHPEAGDEEKYNQLRSIIEAKNCPSIVYVSRTGRADKLAERLTGDGFSARSFHGKMNKEEKSKNQDAFMKGETDIIVATSAFGMGVDKSDVGAVIHYDISDSLENYIQEAGRAGRDEHIEADCYILFNEEDLDKHFILLNQTKLGIKDINQVWKAIKDLTKTRSHVSNSALEIARKAGWDEGISNLETRVTSAIAALEDSGYLVRGQNAPKVYANSILSPNAQEAISKINDSALFDPQLKQKAVRIIKKLFSSKSKRLRTEEEAESRVDYISDQLGMAKQEVIRIVELLREEKILAQAKDLTAFIKRGENINRSLTISDGFRKLEKFLFSAIKQEAAVYHLKELNQQAIDAGITHSTPGSIKTIISFWSIKNWVKQQQHTYSKNHVQVFPQIIKEEWAVRMEKRHLLAKEITGFLYQKSKELNMAGFTEDEVLVEFSVQELKEMATRQMGLFTEKITLDDIEDALFFLSRIEAVKVEGGFLVVYNRLTIERKENNNRIQYKDGDYEKLRQFYQQKVQQIHIVGEYAKKMIRNYEDALQFADDYFNLNYGAFLNRYFPGSRQDEIKRTLTPEKFQKLFGDLSPAQLEIIKDAEHAHIVVAAGPGSGKTKVLAHKLASLLMTEDTRHEQLLMLTFSRAAAGEFKKRLQELIGNAARFVEIKTFHSYCFDLLGQVGSITKSDSVLTEVIEKIERGEIEKNRITKTVLVIDEAQDMDEQEYRLVKALMNENEGMRVILVGDDDQNIFGFRGADSKYMQLLMTENNAFKYELTENYRSKNNIVEWANQWAGRIGKRLKTMPGVAHRQADGFIHITRYKSGHLIVPLVNELRTSPLSGSTCVLTKTNDEAALVAGLLNHYHIRSKLIQDHDTVKLSSLYETRELNRLLALNNETVSIADEMWEAAARQFRDQFKESSHYEMMLSLIREFEATNPKRKYKSDWKALVAESVLQEYLTLESETIFASTMHKAKGREFDNVFLLLADFDTDSDEQKRLLYVAATRAKTNLSVHYNGNYLDDITTSNLRFKQDHTQYGSPDFLSVPLGFDDVNLGYFEYTQHRVVRLTSGETLGVLENGLAGKSGQQVLKFSRKFMEYIAQKKQRGFQLSGARVNFLVYWEQQETKKEYLIVLPEVEFTRENPTHNS